MQKLTLTDKWDKTFPQDARVRHEKVTFHNRYGITLAADLYAPKGETGPFAAIAVCGPFGAVKEQSSGLYAQEMAIRGFLTIAFDPSFTGESGGEPRNVASPDINTEDFQAAVDYLSTRPDVDPERIGIIGICGWGGMALNAAAIDTRIKATAAMTMYDMTRVTAKGYFDAEDSEEARHAKRVAMNAQRTEDYKNGTYARAGGVVDPPARGRAGLRARLLRLLQDPPRLSRALAQLQRRLERDVSAFVFEHADTPVQRRDTQRGACGARRKGALVLFLPRRLRQAARRE